MDKEDKHLSGAGLETVWAKCKNYFLAKGGGTMTGALTVPSLAINGTAATNNLSFTGASEKYIVVPSGRTLTISMNGSANTDLGIQFSGTHFRPAANSTFYLGGNDNRWQAIYGVGLSLTGSASVDTTLSVGGATTLNSTLAVTGEVTLSSHLSLDNARTVRFKDTGGTVRNVLQLNDNNMLAIGYGTSYNNVGYTNIYGTRVDFTIGQSTLKARIDTQGITSYGGVAAMGIADLSIN